MKVYRRRRKQRRFLDKDTASSPYVVARTRYLTERGLCPVYESLYFFFRVLLIKRQKLKIDLPWYRYSK